MKFAFEHVEPRESPAGIHGVEFVTVSSVNCCRSFVELFRLAHVEELHKGVAAIEKQRAAASSSPMERKIFPCCLVELFGLAVTVLAVEEVGEIDLRLGDLALVFQSGERLERQAGTAS